MAWFERRRGVPGVGADAVLPKPLQLDALEAVWTKRAHREHELRLRSDENG